MAGGWRVQSRCNLQASRIVPRIAQPDLQDKRVAKARDSQAFNAAAMVPTVSGLWRDLL